MAGVPKPLLKALGRKCCQANITYPGILCIGLGQKVYYKHPSLRQNYHGEWEFRAISSAWRMVKGKRFVCGSYDFEEENYPLLQWLVGRTLNSIIQPSPFDLSLLFSKGLRVDLFGQSGSDRHLEVFAPNNVYWEWTLGQWIQSGSDEPGERLSAEEEMLNAYEEECHQRWAALVPGECIENCCQTCVFFRPIHGVFYFWDFGICSNGASDYDGKVVSRGSGCTVHSRSLPGQNVEKNDPLPSAGGPGKV